MPGNRGGRGRPPKRAQAKIDQTVGDAIETLRKFIHLEPIPGAKGRTTRAQLLRAAILIIDNQDRFESMEANHPFIDQVAKVTGNPKGRQRNSFQR